MEESSHSPGYPEPNPRKNSGLVDLFAGTGGLPRRRKRAIPEPGTPLTTPNPAIKEVLCVETGEHLPVERVIGTDYGDLVQLRMRVSTGLRNGRPLYRCSICGVPVYPCGTKSTLRFFFRHKHEAGNCPAITRGSLSQAEINARKYNGAKESDRHIKMKAWLVKCLQVDGRFESIASEARWTGALSGDWRRPDVRAVYRGMPIAFEVQLSTTYLNVIAERRAFYLEQGGLLFWVFAFFDAEHGRMTEDDVFYNNNRNAFVINEDTVNASIERAEFFLECVWVEPTKSGGTSAFHRKRVPFTELTLEPTSQRAFYFDFEGQKKHIADEKSAETQNLRDEFEAWRGDSRIGSTYQLESEIWDKFRTRFIRHGIVLPELLVSFRSDAVTALYSAKNNRPWGQRRNHLIEVAHQTASSHKELLIWFMHAVRHYGRLESMAHEGDPAKWRSKYEACRSEFKSHPQLYQPPENQRKLLEFLFPELGPLP